MLIERADFEDLAALAAPLGGAGRHEQELEGPAHPQRHARLQDTLGGNAQIRTGIQPRFDPVVELRRIETAPPLRRHLGRLRRVIGRRHAARHLVIGRRQWQVGALHGSARAAGEHQCETRRNGGKSDHLHVHSEANATTGSSPAALFAGR